MLASTEVNFLVNHPGAITEVEMAPPKTNLEKVMERLLEGVVLGKNYLAIGRGVSDAIIHSEPRYKPSCARAERSGALEILIIPA